MPDRHRHAVHGRRQIAILDQRDVMVLHLAVVVATVEPHAWRVRPVRRSLALADLLEPQNLRPEPVRLVEVANVEDKMVQSDRGDRAGRR